MCTCMCCTFLLACSVPNPGCTNYLQDQLMDNKSSFSVYSLLLNKNTDASRCNVGCHWHAIVSDLGIRKDVFDILLMKHPSAVFDILM
jgi:hypothetical protein